MRHKVDIFDVENALISLGGEAETREIQDEVLRSCCSGEIPENYRSDKSFRQTIQDLINSHSINDINFDADKKPAKFMRVGFGIYRYITDSSRKGILAINEVEEIKELLEGSVWRSLSNKYERNPEARRRCISHYGWRCDVCKFDFRAFYGERGRDFIHVHHTALISKRKSKYKVDPIKDLIPLCANCHAMIHRTNEPLSVEQLKKEIQSSTTRNI